MTRQSTAAIKPIRIPQQQLSHIHVDLVGPLPTSKEGYRYLFTMVDRMSRWLEAVPLGTMEATACAAALINTWVFRFAIPLNITSDQGRQCSSKVQPEAHACQALGIHHNTTTAYHPQCNGMVERVHGQLKDTLKACLAAAEWPQHLPWVLLGLRVDPKDDSKQSLAAGEGGGPQVFHAGNWRKSGDCDSGQAEASHGSGPSNTSGPSLAWLPPGGSPNTSNSRWHQGHQQKLLLTSDQPGAPTITRPAGDGNGRPARECWPSARLRP